MYKEMNAGEMHQALGMDGYKWADAFMEIWGDKLQEVDRSLMVAWFCNSVNAGYDAACKKLNSEE